MTGRVDPDSTARHLRSPILVMHLAGSWPQARHHLTNSTGSIRRSPVSVLWTNVWGFLSLWPSSRCVRPASSRHFRSSLHSLRYEGLCCGLVPTRGTRYNQLRLFLAWEHRTRSHARGESTARIASLDCVDLCCGGFNVATKTLVLAVTPPSLLTCWSTGDSPRDPMVCLRRPPEG